MPNTSTIAAIAVAAAAAVGVAYVAQPQLFGLAPSTAPPAKTAAAPATAPVTKPTAETAAKPAPAAAPVVVAQSPAAPPAPAATTPPPGASKQPAEAALPSAWVGLPVIAADGATIGQVSEIRPHADGRSVVLAVRGADGKTYDISSAMASMQGRAVQLTATAADIAKMAR